MTDKETQQCLITEIMNDDARDGLYKLNLYKVTLRGMTYSSTGMVHGVAYVVAGNPSEAYNKMRKHLDKKDIGFRRDRELHTIELLASDYEYNDTDIMLFL